MGSFAGKEKWLGRLIIFLMYLCGKLAGVMNDTGMKRTPGSLESGGDWALCSFSSSDEQTDEYMNGLLRRV